MFEQMRMDAICALIDELEEGYTGDYYDLHDEGFILPFGFGLSYSKLSICG